MKKSRLIIYVTLLLIGVLLSGCFEKNSNDGKQPLENSVIGDWEIFRTATDYEFWSFYTNGSAKNTITENVEGTIMTTIVWYEYTKDNSSVCFSAKNESADSPNYFSMCFSYRFSDDTTHLILSSNNIVIMDLVKVS